MIEQCQNFEGDAFLYHLIYWKPLSLSNICDSKVLGCLHPTKTSVFLCLSPRRFAWCCNKVSFNGRVGIVRWRTTHWLLLSRRWRMLSAPSLAFSDLGNCEHQEKKKISSARHTFLGQVGSIILQQEVTSISLSPNYCFNSQAWTWAYSSECFPTPNWLDGVRVEWNIDEDKGEQVAGKVDNHAWQKQRQRTTSRGSVLFLKDMERPRKKHQRRWATFWSLVS